MKIIKTVAIGACATVALGVGVSSATAGSPTKSGTSSGTSLKMQDWVGSCVADGAPGKVSIDRGVANLNVPEQMSWAQIRTSPQGLQLKDLKTLKFDSNASDAGVVYAKITTEDGPSVLYSPNTQPGGEQGLGDGMTTHDVLNGTVRIDDDAGQGPDVSWSDVLARTGDAKVKDVRFTAGCANPVDLDGNPGAQVQFDNLTINKKVISFN